MANDVRAEMYIDKSKRDIYTQLTEDEDSLFYKRKDTEVFVAAAAIGFYMKKRVPIKGTKHSLYPMSLYKSDDNNLWLLKSIAISVGGIEVLNNLKSVAAIVEEYANGGIDVLYEYHKNSDDEISSMSADLIDIIDSDGIPQQN